MGGRCANQTVVAPGESRIADSLALCVSELVVGVVVSIYVRLAGGRLAQAVGALPSLYAHRSGKRLAASSADSLHFR